MNRKNFSIKALALVSIPIVIMGAIIIAIGTVLKTIGLMLIFKPEDAKSEFKPICKAIRNLQ